MAEIIPNLNENPPLDGQEQQAHIYENKSEQGSKEENLFGVKAGESHENQIDIPGDANFVGHSEQGIKEAIVTDSSVVDITISATPREVMAELLANDVETNISDPSYEMTKAAIGYGNGIEEK